MCMCELYHADKTSSIDLKSLQGEVHRLADTLCCWNITVMHTWEKHHGDHGHHAVVLVSSVVGGEGKGSLVNLRIKVSVS